MSGPLGPTLFAQTAPAAPAPYVFLALDIETTDGSPEEAERWMRLHWLPGSNLTKPETIGRHFQERLEEKRTKLALLDTAPIVCVSMKSESELRCLHSLGAEPPREEAGGLVEGFATPREMLIALRNLLDARCSEDTVLVGHNILGFDLRKLRRAYVYWHVRMPFVLQGTDQPVFDTMTKYGSLFSVGDSKLFVSLDDLLQEFRIESHKGDVDGSMVPAMVQEGRVVELVRYALLDVLAESELFLRMTGQVDDAPAEAQRGAA